MTIVFCQKVLETNIKNKPTEKKIYFAEAIPKERLQILVKCFA